MPSPQEILSDPKFQGLPVGEQLKVMRTIDPKFAALPATEQGGVIAKSRQKSLGYDQIGKQADKTGFLDRLGGDFKSIPATIKDIADVVSPISGRAQKAKGIVDLAAPNIAELKKAKDPSLSKIERFGHGLAAGLPGVGPMAARAGEDIGKGDYGAGAADALELAAPGVMRAVPLGEFTKGFGEGWDEAGRPAPTWKKFPQPKNSTPQLVESIKSQLPSGRKIPTPGSRSTVDAPKVDDMAKSAAELMKTVGIGPDEVLKATPEQWKMIEQQAGGTFDRQAAIKELKAISGVAPKPSPKADLPAGPKTSKPSPGGEKVQSTMDAGARAARADQHADALAKALRKLPSPDSIPKLTDEAAWKLLEDQTGTEATPKVRQAAIDKAKKLWSEGPRSAGDLAKRRADHFENNPKTPPPQ